MTWRIIPIWICARKRSGTLITINAKVTAVAPGKGTPTGTVEITSAGTVVATVVLDGNGNASFSTASLPAEVAPIVANYLGDASYLANASATFNQNIVALSCAAVERGGTDGRRIRRIGHAYGNAQQEQSASLALVAIGFALLVLARRRRSQR